MGLSGTRRALRPQTASQGYLAAGSVVIFDANLVRRSLPSQMRTNGEEEGDLGEVTSSKSRAKEGLESHVGFGARIGQT